MPAAAVDSTLMGVFLDYENYAPGIRGGNLYELSYDDLILQRFARAQGLELPALALSARKTWLEEQASIQNAMSHGEGEEQMSEESQERLDEREKELQDKIDRLEERLASVESEENLIAVEKNALAVDDEKLKKVLKILDELLENLPEDIINKFAKSKDYKHYDELMEELGL